MASVITDYQEHFSLITAEIVAETNKLLKLSGSEKNQASNKIQQLLRDAHDLLEQIDLEIRTVAQKDREKFQTCLKSYGVELNKLESDYKKALISMPREAHMRDELFGSDDALVTEDMRAKLLDNTDKMENSLQRLGDGYRICIETEQIGAQVLEDLSHQRSTLQRSRGRLQKTNEELGKSSRVLSSMLRRTIQNRFLMVLLGIFMLIIVCITLYFIFRPH